MMERVPVGSALTLAHHYVRHYEELAGNTLRTLAAEYEVTPQRMRTVLRTARAEFARKGLVVTVPVRDDGYVIVISDKLYIVLSRCMRRFEPIATELVRHDEDIKVVNGGNSMMNDLIQAFFEMTDEMNDLILEAV